MKAKIFAALLTLSLLGAAAFAQVGPPNNILCNKLAQQTASSSTLLTLQSGVAGQVINVCGWHVTNSSGTAATFQLSSGTGTNCATTNANITPPFSVTSNAPATDHIEFATLSLASGNNLCVVSSATSLQIGVWTSQQ